MSTPPLQPLRRARERLGRMTLRGRVLLAFVGITLLLATPAVFAANRLSQLREIAFELRGQHAAAFLALGRTQRNLAEFERFARSYVAVPGPGLLAGARYALERANANVDRLEEVEYDAEAADARSRLANQEGWLEHIVGMVEAGRLEAATDALGALGPALDEIQETMDVLAATIDRRTVDKVLEAQRISEAAATATLLVAAICFGLALLLGVWSARTLTAPIRRLRRAMAAVAEGSFATPTGLPYERRDEVGALARSFRWMTRRLRELERLRSEYAGVVSHDLKTPLNVIGGYAELLEEGIYTPLAPQQREPVAVIREQTRALAELADQLLEMSRIEATGVRGVEARETPAREFFGSVERAFSVLAEGSGITFAVEVDARLPERIVVDPDRLRAQVLGNLLSNALKFTPSGGRVTLRARLQDGDLHIDVSDTGVGIPEQELPQIFEKFYRVKGDPGTRPKGAGLGLAIAREVVEAHDGRISAESAVDAGTTVHVVLPQPGPAGARERRAA